MKKSTVTILTIIYLAVSTGIVVNLHYCMNRLASCQLYKAPQKTCEKCGMHTEKSGGCCRDEVKVVKMEEDQRIAQAIEVDFSLPEVQAQLPSVFIDAPFINSRELPQEANHPPPLVKGQETYLLINVFRI